MRLNWLLGAMTVGGILFTSLGWGWAQPASNLLQQGYSALNEGNAQEAQAFFNAERTMHPSKPEGLLALAALAQAQGQFAKAQTLLEQACGLSPNNANTWLQLGQLYLNWSQIPGNSQKKPLQAKAKTALEKAKTTAIKGSNTWAEAQAGWASYLIATAGNPNEASAALLQAQTGEAPNNPRVLAATARLYLAQQNYSQAQEVLMQLLETSPHQPEPYELLAQLLLATGHPQQALNTAQQAEGYRLWQSPGQTQLLAQATEQLGQTQDALAYYQQLLRLTPSDADLLNHLGELAEATGNLLTARSYFLKAYTLNPKLKTDLLTSAMTQTNLQQWQGAQAQWSRVLWLYPENDLALNLLPSLFYQQALLGQAKPDELLALCQKLQTLKNPSPLTQIDALKLEIASQGKRLPQQTQALQALSKQTGSVLAPSILVQGEAFWLLGQLQKAQAVWENLEPTDAEDGWLTVQRLLALRALETAKTQAQRALALEKTTQKTTQKTEALQSSLQTIEAQLALTQQKLTTGDAAFAQKTYPQALSAYQQASLGQPALVNAYLKQASTAQQLKQPVTALQALLMALQLQPSLVESPGIKKQLKKLEHQAGMQVNRTPPLPGWPLALTTPNAPASH